jgi:hypothetical protein
VGREEVGLQNYVLPPSQLCLTKIEEKDEFVAWKQNIYCPIIQIRLAQYIKKNWYNFKEQRYNSVNIDIHVYNISKSIGKLKYNMDTNE